MTSFKTKCGSFIVLNKETLSHLEAHPESATLLEEAIAMIVLPTNGTFLMTTVVFDRMIGANACVQADSKEMYFSVRTGRNVPTRVVLGQNPEPTSQFTVLAFKGDNEWVLITGFAGPQAPREPHDQYFSDKRDSSQEFHDALQFWTTHGLCLSEGWSEPYASTWDVELKKVDAKRASSK